MTAIEKINDNLSYLPEIIAFTKHKEPNLFCIAVQGKGCENCHLRFVCEGEIPEDFIKENYPEYFL